MKRTARIHIALVLCLLGGTIARAQDQSKRVAALRYHEGRLKRVAYYVSTHKELLIADTLVVFAEAADAASSVHCQRLPGCVEQNSLLGKHPNELQTWGAAMGFSAGEITLVHLIRYFAPDRFTRHIFWGPVAAQCIREVWNVHSNVNAAEFLQNQRAARLRLAP